MDLRTETTVPRRSAGKAARMVSMVGLGLAMATCLALTPASAGEEPEYRMTTYQFVMLMTGPDQAPMTPEESRQVQRAHLDHLQKLEDEGKMLLVGPIADGGPLRGIAVLTVGSAEEAQAIFDQDPWVKIGRMQAEIHTWWAADGIMRQVDDIMDHRSCYLGLLRRPADAPEFSEAELAELQKGHLANIKKMADSGYLVIAGPMGDDGVLRGIFVFCTPEEEKIERTRSWDPSIIPEEEKIREMVAQDPSIQAGRLEMDLYRWTIPSGSLPDK